MAADGIKGYPNFSIFYQELPKFWLMNGEFPEADFAAVRNVVARLGVADVRAFGLTWEDCEDLLQPTDHR